MTPTLHFQMGVPRSLGSNVILTSPYLINRLPSTPLSGEVPLRLLHLDHDLFPLLASTFEFLVFFHDYFAIKSKLAPQELNGMFIGYSRVQNGYVELKVVACSSSIDLSFRS